MLVSETMYKDLFAGKEVVRDGETLIIHNSKVYKVVEGRIYFKMDLECIRVCDDVEFDEIMSDV